MADTRIVKSDENDFGRSNPARTTHSKNFATKELKKRAALGDLKNKVLTVPSQQKEAAATDLKKKDDFKHIKPRVDCHWKNPVTHSRTSTFITKDKAIPKLTVIRPSTSSEINEFDKKCDATLKRFLNLKKKNVNIISNEIVKNSYDFESHSESRLRQQIQDIDINDKGNALLIPEYINCIMTYLKKVETKFIIPQMFLSKHVEINSNMRAVLIDWINEVHCQFKLVLETYYLTVSLIDSCLMKAPRTKRANLQLLGCAALWVASKYEDCYPPELDDIVYIADQTYNKQQLCEMEKFILRTVDFEMGRAFPIQFLRRYSKAISGDGGLNHSISKYCMELVSLEYSMIHYKPSEIAAACLALSIHLKEKSTYNNSLWTPTLQHYTGYTLEHLKPIIQEVVPLLVNAPKGKLKSIYSKYSSSKQSRVALGPETTNYELLQKLSQM